MSRTILITGATGQVGERVARLLAGDAQGAGLRLMVRDPGRAPKLPNSQVVRGDYVDPASLAAAFAGVDTAFIVSGYAAPGERALLHKNAVDAAAQAGVQHLVYLSYMGAAPDSKFPMARDHYQTEQFLKASGVPFTALRDSMYLDFVPGMFNAEGVIRGPARQGAAAFVPRETAAQVAAAVLRNPPQTSAAYDVTGPEALTLDETARRLSALVGRRLRYEDESVDAGRAWRSKLGAPDWEVETWLGSYEAIAAGELQPVSDTVWRFTGQQPPSLEQFFTAHPDLLQPLRQPKAG